jgi:hypothetical protein
MRKVIKKLVIGFAAALTFSGVLGSTVFAGDVTVRTDSAECIATDVKGSIQFVGNHFSGNPVNGSFVNIASNPECSDEVYVHVFGSNDEPDSPGWLDHQFHIMSQTFTVPQDGIDMPFQLTLPHSDYCWYQVDATRTPDVRIPPYYNGDDMIEYVFVQNKEVCGEVTPTPTQTATPSATPTDTPTPTLGSNNGGGGSSTQSGSSSNDSPKTVESIQAALGATTLAPTGGFVGNVMNLILSTGMIVSALGAVSYAKDKKKVLA